MSRGEGQPQRIVVLQLSSLGDTLFATPALRALREHYPQAKLTVITWQTNRCVLVGNPAVDQLWSVHNTIEAVRLLRRLQKNEQFDLAVGLSHRGSALLAFSNAPQRVGFNAQNLGWLYNKEVPDRRDIHAVEYCLEVLRPLGIEPHNPGTMEFYYTARDREVAADFLRNSSGYPLVAMHPGGKFFPAKRWHPAGFAQVADYIKDKLKAKVVLVGGRDDVKLAAEIASRMSHPPLIAAGLTSLKETAAIIARANLFVGNDSAPQHLAASFAVPVVSLFGPTDPANFHPWGVPHRIVRSTLDCSPCFRWLGSPMQFLPSWDHPTCQRQCMCAIEAASVIGQIEELCEEIAGRNGTLR